MSSLIKNALKYEGLMTASRQKVNTKSDTVTVKFTKPGQYVVRETDGSFRVCDPNEARSTYKGLK